MTQNPYALGRRGLAGGLIGTGLTFIFGAVSLLIFGGAFALPLAEIFMVIGLVMLTLALVILKTLPRSASPTTTRSGTAS